MLELIKRTRILMLVSIAGLSLFIYFIIFNPMLTELRNSLYANITEISMSKYTSLQSTVNGALMGSASLSSRSTIRDEIAQYQNGEINFDQLKTFTQPKYEDGVTVLENVVFAQRIVDGQVVASYQSPAFSSKDFVTMEGYNHSLSAQFLHTGENLYVKVFSPVMQNQNELGVDVVLYDFTQPLAGLNDPTYTANIINVDAFDSLKQQSGILLQNTDSILLGGDESLYFAKSIDNHYFLVQVNRKSVFSSITSLTINIAVAWIIIFVALLLAVYFYIIRYANKRITHVEESRDAYKNLAYSDKMTGLYSKLYLEIWKTNLRKLFQKYSLIMVDVDRFKKINDRYGHITGDEVLRLIAQIFLTSIRENDIAIRFGGDEFLLILNNSNENQAKTMIDRINAKLTQIESFSFPLSISYGISNLEPGGDFNAALKLADQEMYASKKNKSNPFDETLPKNTF